MDTKPTKMKHTDEKLKGELLLSIARASIAEALGQEYDGYPEDLPAWLLEDLSLIHISEPTRRRDSSRMPSSA